MHDTLLFGLIGERIDLWEEEVHLVSSLGGIAQMTVDVRSVLSFNLDEGVHTWLMEIIPIVPLELGGPPVKTKFNHLTLSLFICKIEPDKTVGIFSAKVF
jgi:hypothetical protein